MCRLYPALAGYMTRYIPRERARSSEVEEALGAKPEALPRLYESISPFPRDITGHYIPLMRDITYLCHAKGCSDLGHMTRREI